MKKNLIFLGPPACGKGTQTNRLAEYLGFPHVDTGSLLRAEIANDSEEGRIAKSFIDKGQLVPAELVGKIIAKKLAGEDCKNGYVLDGYPRSLEQAEMLEKINADVDAGKETSFKAIYFDIDTQILIKRIIYRQSCPKCGEIFNKKFKPAKVDGKCDKCGADLKTRADDNEETFKIRYDEYMNNTKPVVDYFNKINRLGVVNVTDNLEETLLQVEKYLEV